MWLPLCVGNVCVTGVSVSVVRSVSVCVVSPLFGYVSEDELSAHLGLDEGRPWSNGGQSSKAGSSLADSWR